MGINPGLLREQLTLQEPTPTTDAIGGQTTAWAAVTSDPTVWGRVTPVSTHQRMKSMQVDSLATHEVTVRYRADVDIQKRWLWGSTVLVIVSDPVNADERGEYITMTCRSEAV